MNAVSAPPAGNSAERHFRSLRRRWRRRMAPTLAVASGAFFAAALMTARLLPWQPTFTAGVLAGGGLTLFLWAWDDPPEVIAKWGRGAAGERMTGKALRGLPADWYVRHDLQARYGNLDHVVVGPGGVFLLDSKNLGGRALVENGVLQVRFPESPIDDYACTGLPRTLYGRAAALRERLKADLGWIVEVHPVVVLLGLFPERRAEAGRLAYLQVDELVPWLLEQPTRVAPQDVQAIRRIVSRLPAAADLVRVPRKPTSAHRGQ